MSGSVSGLSSRASRNAASARARRRRAEAPGQRHAPRERPASSAITQSHASIANASAATGVLMRV